MALPPIPECDACPFRLWPARCHAALSGVRRYCELPGEYATWLVRTTLGGGEPPAPEPSPAGPASAPGKCCGQADPTAFFGTPEPSS